MTTVEIGKQLVAFCQDQKGLDAVDALYDEKIVSIEAQGSDELPAGDPSDLVVPLDYLQGEWCNTDGEAWVFDGETL